MTEGGDGSEVQALFLRLANFSDLPVLVRIHKQAYSRSHFTALLTDETLARYYSYFLSDDTEILLALNNGISDSEKAVGFAVYGRGIPDRIAQFKKEARGDILLTSLRHPFQALRKLTVAIRCKLSAGVDYKPADFLLLSIAVIQKRGGIGGYLLRTMLKEAQKNHAKTVGLYVNADNLIAINAYFAAGFVLRHYQNGQFYMEFSNE